MRRAYTDLERRVEERTAELNARDRHKDEFLAMLGHELRNPLAPIRNALEILKARGRAGGDAQPGAGLDRAPGASTWCGWSTTCSTSRASCRARSSCATSASPLAAVVERAIETAQPTIDARGHQLAVSLPPAPVFIHGDLIRLAQVLSNLLVNAAKYTPQAGEHRAHRHRRGTTSCASASQTPASACRPELLPKVFDFFVQGSRSLERSQGGLGIGLTLVKRLVEMHGGTVTAHSAGAGKGSELVVDLPLPDQAATDDVPPPAARATAVGGRRRRVLVVDDNVDAAESAAALLSIWGHEVRTVHDGLSVLRQVEAFRPDIVLLDIGLPGKSGYDVARELRAQPASPVRLIAAMTGYGQAEDRQRSAEAGFDVHLTKPLDLEQLRDLLVSGRA